MLTLFFVENLDDSGPGSFRAAIDAANLSAGPDQINFQTWGKLHLTSQLPTITDSVYIFGTGADVLTIDAGNGADQIPGTVDGFGVFSIDKPAGSIDVDIRYMSITGGDVGGRGGAIDNRENLTITDCRIVGNAAYDGGGGIYNTGTMTISSSTVSTNAANFKNGGGVFNTGTLNVSNSTISGNSASNGGGLFSSGGMVTITNSTISGNAVSGDGGGVGNVASAMTIANSTIASNYAQKGGGIFNYGTTTITNTTISRNSARSNGGGIVNFFSATITSSTISGNSASEGGGIFNEFTATIAGSLITGNSAPTGSEIRRAQGTVNLNAFNLIGESSKTTAQALSGVSTGPNDILATSNGTVPTALAAIIAPRANNGGPTETHALVAGSPAINAGNPNFTPPPNFDQRGAGYERVVNGRVDIGALEVQAPSADFDGDGDVDGRDLLAWQRGFGTPAPTADKSQGDADNNLAVDGDDLTVWQGQYGMGSFVAEVEEGVGDGEQRTEIADLGFLMTDDGEKEGSPLVILVPASSTAGQASSGTLAVEDLYVEEVDRAIQQFATMPSGVRSFGEMVARRGVAKDRVGIEAL
jgi:hypothetical protein